MRIENDYRDRLRGRLWDRLWGRLWDRLEARLRDRLWDRLEGRLRDRLGVRLWDRLGGRLEDANGDIVGHISDVGDGAMITQCANGWDALQSKRDRLQEQVMLLRESLAGLCDSQLTSWDREDAIVRGLAALEATEEKT